MDGCYVEYEIRGHVVIRIRKETTPDFIENGGYYRRYGEFNGLFFGKK